MKILDRYILTSFLKTFFSVFIILMFIFVLQAIWLYIGELAGKDLDIGIILKFLWFFSPKMMPLVLPLTILVSSLMVFGSFAEKYEFAAMKSTGISLQRAMGSLIVFILLLSATAFFFANNVIPYSEYKWQNLRRNLAQVSPSMVIVEGQFSQIGDLFNIKVDEKSGDRDQFLKEVVIHKKNETNPNENHTVIIAKNGELASAEGSNTLTLILKEGNYYEDIQPRDAQKRQKKPFAKSYFEEYAINIDLTKLNSIDIEKENEVDNQNMYKISELRVEIDSLSNTYSHDIKSYTDNMYSRSGIAKFTDISVKDTLSPASIGSLLDIFKTPRKKEIVGLALNNAKGTLQIVEAKKSEFQNTIKRLNKNEIALHEKYALAVACIILFFVGAPLGAIIRKGGMGLPMVIAILLFLTYHFIGIFAKNSAEDGTMHPFIATWLSTFIMLPLSIWLTYRATTDQGLFDIDSFLQRIGRLFNKKENNLEKEILFENLAISSNVSNQEIADLSLKSTERLKDIVKNYRQYNYSKGYRIEALKLLSARGITQEHLNISGDLYNKNYEKGIALVVEFKKNSKITLFIFIVSVLLVVFMNIPPINISHVLSIVSFSMYFLSIVLFYIYLYKSHTNVKDFKTLLNKKFDINFWIVFFIGYPLFILLYFYYKNNIRQSINEIR